ncbi:hypothetical protein LPJ57_002294 [Coemansia sp. RSA 486]|nr:hypothetical protein LPJ57_002294 [Coemansia sp. RSA 486]KAJ2238451.1 hypothetical protein IWW45_000071 [Coemansia sp. RSA 485]
MTKATSLPAKDWRIGDQCEAKYAADGNFYAARVVAVRGGNVFQVAFVGYGDMQETKAQDMRATETQGTTRVQAAETSKNKSDGSKVQQGGRVDKNKAAKNKKNGSSTTAAAAQQAWLAFAKGNGSSSSGGKKLKAKAINDKSIFKSPDTVSGKVGVARHTKKK